MADRGGSVLVPKGPRAQQAADEAEAPAVDIAEIRAQLLAMPVPPQPQGRPYSTTTVLGRVMRLRRLTVNDVAKVPGGPAARQISDVLNGNRTLSNDEKRALAKGLGIDVRLLD